MVARYQLRHCSVGPYRQGPPSLGTGQCPDSCVQVRRVEIHEMKSIPSCVGVPAHTILALSSGLCLAFFPEPNSARVSCSQNGDN